jgi:hypothetical protein
MTTTHATYRPGLDRPGAGRRAMAARLRAKGQQR